MQHTLSCQALYDAVWTTPISHLAPEYGLTGTGLKKICDRHDIPTPHRGYWARLANAKCVTRTPLPTRRLSADARVCFQGVTESALPAAVQAAKSEALARAAELAAPPPTAAPVEAASGTEPAGDDPGHPVAQRVAKALSRAKPDAGGFVAAKADALPSLVIGRASIDRGACFIGRLLHAAEALGWAHEPSPQGLKIVIADESIGFGLIEKTTRVPHAPTAREQHEKARAEAKGQAPAPWSDNPAPSGVLSFEIRENTYVPLTRRYSDLKRRPLEDRLDEILAGLAAHAALNVEDRRKAEEARRIAAESEAERKREAAFEGREKRRVEFLGAVHAQLVERDRLAAVAAGHRPPRSQEPG